MQQYRQTEHKVFHDEFHCCIRDLPVCVAIRGHVTALVTLPFRKHTFCLLVCLVNLM